MRILTIFTGGTIGSYANGEYISPIMDDKKYFLLEKYKEKYGDDVTFETISPYTILSENLCADNLTSLAKCIRNNLEKACYDGIIVTHGTDTLQYSCAAMSYVFSDADIPIVFVSSNYILTDPRANGLSNLRSAVLFIKAKGGNGVFCSYRNSSGTGIIHHGEFVLPHSQFNDDLFSVSDNYFGTIKEGTYQENSSYMCPPDECIIPNIKDVIYVEQPPVLYFRAFPGQIYPQIFPSTKAVIIESYHSGTLCTCGEALNSFAKEAVESGIPVFVSGIEDRMAYESSMHFDNMGLIPLPKSSSIYSYMKLWTIISVLPNISPEMIIKYMTH